ncbi:MAG: type II toxin-antitoxin system RelE family toxin [Candidatus Woesearchaeota archaeon]
MSYHLFVHSSCQNTIKKAVHKNPALQKALEKKIAEIQKNPHRFKPLRGNMSGIRRVHILKSFVLCYKVDDTQEQIILLIFSHHDNVYG